MALLSLASSAEQRDDRELLALYNIAQSLCSVHDLDLLLRFAIEQVVALLEVESSAVLLLDEERKELYFKAADDTRSGAEQKLQEIRLPADKGIAGWVLREGVAVAVPNVEQDPRFYREVDKQTGVKTKSYLCVPLKTKGRIIGVLTAVNKRNGDFSQEDVRLLEALGVRSPSPSRMRG
jgi:GAF domain-containing protein